MGKSLGTSMQTGHSKVKAKVVINDIFKLSLIFFKSKYFDTSPKLKIITVRIFENELQISD
jgi:hypothetical protein